MPIYLEQVKLAEIATLFHVLLLMFTLERRPQVKSVPKHEKGQSSSNQFLFC